MEWMKEKKERKVFKRKEELNEDFQIFIEQRSIYTNNHMSALFYQRLC